MAGPGPEDADVALHDVQEWCRRVAGDDALTFTGIPDVPSRPVPVIALPGTLEWADDPGALIEALAGELAPRGRLVAGVTWASPSPSGSRRGFHPASLLGVVSSGFEVVDLEIQPRVLGVVAVPEFDPTRRELAALRALQRAQPCIEEHLERGLTLQSEVAALRDALVSAEHAIVAADDAEHEARRQRNAARSKLRTSRARVEELEAVNTAAQARIADLAGELDDERSRAENLRARLDRIEATRAYRLWARLQPVRRRLAAVRVGRS